MKSAALYSFCPSCGALFKSRPRRCPADGSAVKQSETDPLLGWRLSGTYRLEALVGKGATGRVYRARCAGPPGAVAVKLLYGERAAEPRHAERFAREAARAVRLSHPNLVSVLDAGHTDSGLPYLVMEYVDGRRLIELLDQEGPLEAARARSLLIDLCRALSYLHGRGLIHRDLKGDNVMVTEGAGGETARLLDLGIALEREADATRRLTGEQSAVGTATYMAPEQALGEPVDHRADLFSLGVLLYQMLAGSPPFAGSPTLVALQNATMTPPPVSARTPGLEADPLLEAIARKLMERNPGDRFQSAGDVLDAAGC